jgi:glucan phosphoethanolaminetransferase (alkaline phosphatase superfamily)
MFKVIQKHLDKDVVRLSVIFALLYCVLFNSAIIVYKFEYYQANILTGVLELVKDFIYNFITLFLFFFGLSFNRYIFVLGSLFLFMTGAITSYYLFYFGVSPSLAIMPAIFGTHQTEAMELISLRIVLWCVFNFIVCVYGIYRYLPNKSLPIITRILTLVCLVLTINNIISPKYSFLKSNFPVQYLHNAYLYIFAQDEDFIKKDISLDHDYIDKSDEDALGVLVIGEAARYSNFGINGYGRDTTPNLEKLHSLVNYKAISCSNTTFLSVPCMLSRYGEKDLNLVEKETSILSILTKLGFETLWMGTQSITKYYRNKLGGSFYNEVDFHMIPGGSLVFLPNDLDGKMLPYLEKSLQDEKYGKKFIVMHSTGSHWNYSARYPIEFEKFKPAIDINANIDASGCLNEELVNSYDNSILYTDYFLSEVIDRLKNENAFLIYASDHGESLGECGRLTHGSDGYFAEQREVPIMVWFSDKYIKNHPEKWEAVKSFQKDLISHDNIFHSILGCLGIESEIVDESLNLCKKNP